MEYPMSDYERNRRDSRVGRLDMNLKTWSNSKAIKSINGDLVSCSHLILTDGSVYSHYDLREMAMGYDYDPHYFFLVGYIDDIENLFDHLDIEGGELAEYFDEDEEFSVADLTATHIADYGCDYGYYEDNDPIDSAEFIEILRKLEFGKE